MARLKVLLLILYVVTIFFLSSRPYLTSPGPKFKLRDKVSHCVEYCGLGVLLVVGIGATVSRSRPGLVFMFLFAVGISVGALDEMLQSYIPGRSMDIYDWIADVIGVALGIGITIMVTHRRRIANGSAT